jgi:hypothetical protein
MAHLRKWSVNLLNYQVRFVSAQADPVSRLHNNSVVEFERTAVQKGAISAQWAHRPAHPLPTENQVIAGYTGAIRAWNGGCLPPPDGVGGAKGIEGTVGT